ncbi:cation diffusion facilitator family transporter [Sphingomonas quercus]|uniref:Cation diffusion facilitator family transporter n=1 Tax=Sphingomonas quercus TaxID=2842451 RepID=A0ABS6BIA4_9SPHN|nr:cation diffusion facilitator family transporter [Sphingomonas quercus]
MSGPSASRAAAASVATALFLLGLKAVAAWRTGSVAMLGSLADTGLDLVASLVTLWGVRVAATPADREHRFGHGKAEALAALFQVALISVSAIGIGWQALSALLGGETSRDAGYGIAVSVVAMLATVLLLGYQRRVIAATGSLAISADNVHYQSDFALNGAVILALVLEQWLGLGGADPVLGVAIALWLMFGAWRAASAAVDQLMDKEWPEEKRRRFLEIAARHPELAGIHDLRTRTAGAQDFVQFHVWVDPQMTVAEAHRVMDEVEARLARDFPGVEILIHVDPEGQEDKEGVLPAAIAEEPSQ